MPTGKTTLTRLLQAKPAALVYVEEIKRIPNSLWAWEAVLVFVDEAHSSAYASFGRHRFTDVLLQGETEDELRQSIRRFMLTPVEVVFPSVGQAHEAMLSEFGQLGHADHMGHTGQGA